MKKISLLLLSILLMLACGKKQDEPDTSKKALTQGDYPMLTPSGYFYYGEHNLENNQKQRIFMVFDPDGLIKYQYQNIGRDNFPTIKEGRWSLKEGIITIEIQKEKPIYYLINNDKNISLLNADGTQQDELNTDNPLIKAKKLTIDETEGTYLRGTDTMTIKAREYEDEYSITISSPNNECKLQGNGRLAHNRIYVELNPINEKLKSQMTITFIDKDAYIFTSKSEDAKDLAKFCSKGKTLIGNYKKN